MNKSKHNLFYIICIGGITFLAGAINICAMILLGMNIAHYTGSISNAAIAFSNGNIRLFSSYLTYILLFFLGSITAGLIFYERKPGLSLSHAIIPILLGILIVMALKFSSNSKIILRTLAFGMGLQNGTYIKAEGIIIRVTHMTGHLTDAAFSLGSILRGNREDIHKLRICLFSILAFFAGGLMSGIIVRFFEFRALQILGILYILIGIIVFCGFLAEKYKEDGFRIGYKVNKYRDFFS